MKDLPPLPEQKRTLRQLMNRRLVSFPPNLQSQAQERASEHLQALLVSLLPMLSKGGLESVPESILAVFSALASEPSPVDAALAVAGSERLAWPRAAGDSMVFAQSPPHALQASSKWGSLEPPSSAPEVLPSLVVLPGRAFDRQGSRLGRGGGFYDRALDMLPQGTPLIGFCFAIQVVDRLPIEAHDRQVHWLVTEEGVENCQPFPAPSP